MTTQTKQIESTGHYLTISQREQEARRHIVNTLARTEQQLWVLGVRLAAKHCRAAIDELKSNIPTKSKGEKDESCTRRD